MFEDLRHTGAWPVGEKAALPRWTFVVKCEGRVNRIGKIKATNANTISRVSSLIHWDEILPVMFDDSGDAFSGTLQDGVIHFPGMVIIKNECDVINTLQIVSRDF